MEHLLGANRIVKSDDLNSDFFSDDYERAFEESLLEGADMLYAASPFTGFPWLEAMFGCSVTSRENSFIALPAAGADFTREIRISDYDWINKYYKFIDLINRNGAERYPAGQPILRGPGDVLAAIFESKNFITFFYEYPEYAKQRLQEISNAFLGLVKESLERSSSFHSGYSMGFYPIWCPGKALWFQDDITALLSPDIYNEFFFDIHKKHANAFEYSMIHLHPDSFYAIERLLTIDFLKAIQINKDTGGPSVNEMLPVLRDVLAKKNLVLWGDFTDYEIEQLTSGLNAEGLFIIVHRERSCP